MDVVQQAIKQAIKAAFNLEVEPQLQIAEAAHGDFSTNVAFQLAQRLKCSPADLAVDLAAKTKHSEIESAVAVGGYVNIRLQDSYWIAELQKINHEYGWSQVGKGQKVQVEFISANPTGPTTIGNARGGYIGDAIARVLESQGWDVTREYYFNNAGTQISKLIESVKVAAGLAETDDLQYRGDYIEELASDFAEELKTKSDEELRELLTQAILERWIKPALDQMGIHFDAWFNEQDLITDGRFQQTIDKLAKKGLVYEREGATWLDTGKLGVAREARVLIKSNGDPTYLAPDIAYHDDLFGNRGFKRAIKVLGPDHIDQFPSVRAAVLVLHSKAELEMAGHQWFRLIRNGHEVKVSKRLGQFVTISALIDEVGPDVARFITLSRAAESHMDFDLDLAREQSAKNPLFYVMYAYARSCSILEKAREKKLDTGNSISVLSSIERELIKTLSQWPQLLIDISNDYSVHRLTFYGQELAKLFHDFYESERIVDLPQDEASQKLFLVDQFRVFMEDYFKVLGIEPRQRME